ncbi:MAG: hypothetical protein JEZ06_22830 [Anaerolineaceae bacterium]|nr:hypothetical protein [Anaerolineaceae bacterium]
MPNLLEKLNPVVPKAALHFTAGLIWFGVGLMLIRYAVTWELMLAYPGSLWVLITGLALGSGIYFFGFSRLAKKNIMRINAYQSDKVCLFAFQKWSSYPLVVFMISLGIYLRVYSSLPKYLLSILYFGIGGGILSSSIHYFVEIARKMFQKNERNEGL